MADFGLGTNDTQNTLLLMVPIWETQIPVVLTENATANLQNVTVYYRWKITFYKSVDGTDAGTNFSNIETISNADIKNNGKQFAIPSGFKGLIKSYKATYTPMRGDNKDLMTSDYIQSNTSLGTQIQNLAGGIQYSGISPLWDTKGIKVAFNTTYGKDKMNIVYVLPGWKITLYNGTTTTQSWTNNIKQADGTYKTLKTIFPSSTTNTVGVIIGNKSDAYSALWIGFA